jgi:hypothetical protein
MNIISNSFRVKCKNKFVLTNGDKFPNKTHRFQSLGEKVFEQTNDDNKWDGLIWQKVLIFTSFYYLYNAYNGSLKVIR